ncbi:MAG: NADH-quinone oxidoreductase subunit J [Candidatus Micrarchaeota archaeon]|nr:MAG: NADH-quinone oxidoreductase subunit J [Candidatus Micrarchaeota archaeon]
MLLIYIISAIYIIVALAASYFIFYQRDIIKAVIALSSIFLFSGILLLSYNLILLGLLQILITIGGISTYLVVGVANADIERFKGFRSIAYMLVTAVLFASFLYIIYISNISNTEEGFSSSAISYQIYSSLSNIVLYLVISIYLVSLGAAAVYALVSNRRGD